MNIYYRQSSKFMNSLGAKQLLQSSCVFWCSRLHMKCTVLPHELRPCIYHAFLCALCISDCITVYFPPFLGMVSWPLVFSFPASVFERPFEHLLRQSVPWATIVNSVFSCGDFLQAFINLFFHFYSSFSSYRMNVK